MIRVCTKNLVLLVAYRLFVARIFLSLVLSRLPVALIGRVEVLFLPISLPCGVLSPSHN
jgi:hypothetical protein